MLTDALGHRHRASKQSLLVIAENLLHGEIVSGGAKSADASGHHHDVLLARVDSFESPSQMGERVVIAHRHQHVTATNVQGGAFHRIALKELELVFHRLLSQRRLSMIHALRNAEDNEKDNRK